MATIKSALDITLEEEFQEHQMVIKDMVAWKEYCEIAHHPLLNEQRVQPTSDVNLQVDLLILPHRLKVKINHLPEEEKQKLMALHTAARIAQAQRSQAKRKALGTHMQNRYITENDLLTPKRAEILEMFGRFYSIQEVHKVITVDWGYEVSIPVLEYFRTKNIERIKELNEHFKRDYSDIRLGYKRSRLDELSYLYNDRKQRYKLSGGREDYKLLLTTIEQIRKEVEGDSLRIDGTIDINIQATLNFHIFQDMLCDLSIIDIIISKICARNNYNPQYLMTKLRSSMYARLTGFQKPAEDGSRQEDNEITFPSQIIYDFSRIERMHMGDNRAEELKKQRLDYIDAEVILSDQDQNKIKITREEILARLQKRKQKLTVSSLEMENEAVHKQDEHIEEEVDQEKAEALKEKRKKVMEANRQKKRK